MPGSKAAILPPSPPPPPPIPLPQHLVSLHVPVLQKLRLPGGEAAVKFSEAPRFAGMLRPREYVTCDAADKKERLFVCKSCEVERGEAAVPQRGRVRANLLFALRAQERKGRPGCHVQVRVHPT